MPSRPFPRRALLAAAGLGCAGGAHAAEPVLVGGTGSATGLLRHLAGAQAARTGGAFRIVPSLGSAGGLRALAAGRLDIALTLRDSGPENAALRPRVLGRTPVVLATHRATPSANLTVAQAGRLLAAEDRTWPDGAPARVVQRPPAEREWWALREGPPELARALDGSARRIGALVANTAQDNAQALGAIEGSFGLIQLGQILAEGLDLRVVSLDGVAPSLAGLRDGTWPYGVVIYLIVHAAPRPEVEAFLRFLGSAEAAAICTGLGYDFAAQGA